MDSRDGLVLWVLGGAGVLLIYSAVKNKTPASVIKARLAGGQVVNIAPPAGPVSGAVLVPAPGNTPELASGTTVAGAPFVQADVTGLYSAYAPNGQVLGTLPPTYQKSPGTYIVPPGAVSI